MSDRPFSASLSRGHAAERDWVESQRLLGRSVAHGKKLVVLRHCRMNDHVESPDALVAMSVEIKERSIRFTGPEDYPYDTVIVDDMRGMALEGYRHFAYVYISKPTGCWVWLSSLDRDDSWSEGVCYDRGRGHDVRCLYAPKAHLRPSHQLTYLIYPNDHLDLVDGDSELFVRGGGEAETRERYVAKNN